MLNSLGMDNLQNNADKKTDSFAHTMHLKCLLKQQRVLWEWGGVGWECLENPG